MTTTRCEMCDATTLCSGCGACEWCGWDSLTRATLNIVDCCDVMRAAWRAKLLPGKSSGEGQS